MIRFLQTLALAALLLLPAVGLRAQESAESDIPRHPRLAPPGMHRDPESRGEGLNGARAGAVPAGPHAAPGVTDEEHGAASPGLLDPDPGSAIWSIVLFLILLAILGKFAWGPILKGLQDREAKVRNDLEEADRAARDAKATLQQYQTQLAAAREEGARIVENSRREAERVAHQVQEEARAEIDALRKRATGEIQFAKEEALRDIFTRTANLATDIAGQILRREIRPEDQSRLVQEALAGVSKQDLN